MLKKIRRYDGLTGFSKIARRYAVMNSFDGVLTGLGVILGAKAAGITNPQTVLLLCFSTAIALGFSGATGAFVAEEAERAKERREMEKQLMRGLKNSDLGKAYDFAAKATATVNAFAPFLSVLIVATPFAFIQEIDYSYQAATALSFSLLFALGALLGRDSKTGWVRGGAKMLLAGIATLLVMQLLNA